VAKITAHDNGVHVCGPISLDRCGAPCEKRGLDQAVERYQPQQVTAQLLHRQRGGEQYPIHKPSVDRRHGAAVVGGPAGRQLFDGVHHQRSGHVSGIRESEQVAHHRRAQAVRDQEHGHGANHSEEKLQTAEAAPFLGPGEQDLPRFGGVT